MFYALKTLIGRRKVKVAYTTVSQFDFPSLKIKRQNLMQPWRSWRFPLNSLAERTNLVIITAATALLLTTCRITSEILALSQQS